MHRIALSAGCALALLAGIAFAENEPAPGSPVGRWLTASGNLEVEVAPCGDALCGTVVRVLANRSMAPGGGEMKPKDARDPMGMQVLSGLVASEFRDEGGRRIPTEWRGHVYNRENAKTYRCIVSLGPRGEMLVRGYVGIPWFGSTAAWTRAGVAVGGAR